MMEAIALPLAPPMPRPRRAAVAPQLADIRFRQLLGARQWQALPGPVRQRFAKRLMPGNAAVYRGTIESCEMNLAGWLLAQACRLIGAPLPLDRAGGMATTVTITQDGASGGQVWSRLYARPRGFPQVIHSAKRFAGETGLEEYLGLGFGMALKLSVFPGGMRFTSNHYFWQCGNLRLRLAAWLAPGRLQIDHDDLGEGRFRFTLKLTHRLFGRLVHQRSLFSDQRDFAPQENVA